MDAKPTDDKSGKPKRKSYLPRSRVGRKAITVHVRPEWSKSLKIYGARTGRPLQSLVEEALVDLARKLNIDLDLKDEDDAGETRGNGPPPKV